jgi:hypothetical protein
MKVARVHSSFSLSVISVCSVVEGITASHFKNAGNSTNCGVQGSKQSHQRKKNRLLEASRRFFGFSIFQPLPEADAMS